MNKIITLKSLRDNMQAYAQKVQEGSSFIVFKRSRPLFKITPVEEGPWEEVIDFTKLQQGGVDIKALLKRL